MMIWAAVISGTPSLLHAHADRLIELKGTTLVGLPKDYMPANLDVKAFRLRIGNRELTFPPSLKDFFEQPHELTLFASWYHDARILPPYIVLHVEPKKKDYSYRLLLNLRTLEVIEISVLLKISDSIERRLPIELPDYWKKEIRESIRTLK